MASLAFANGFEQIVLACHFKFVIVREKRQDHATEGIQPVGLYKYGCATAMHCSHHRKGCSINVSLAYYAGTLFQVAQGRQYLLLYH